MRRRTALVSLAIFVLVFVAGFCIGNSLKNPEEKHVTNVSSTSQISIDDAAPYASVGSNSTSYIPNWTLIESSVSTILSNASGTYTFSFYDIETGYSLDYCGPASMESASMIKLLVLAELFDCVNKGETSLSETLVVSQSDIVDGAGSVKNDSVGTSYSLEELARRMISESDNTAANMLIDRLSIQAINEEAANIKLNGSSLGRKLYDQEGRAAGLRNVMSAEDTVTIMKMIYSGTFYSKELSALALSFLTNQEYTDGISLGLPDGIVFAHKTGWNEGYFYNGTQNDGGIVYAARPYIVCIMSDSICTDEALKVIQEVSQVIYEGTQP